MNGTARGLVRSAGGACLIGFALSVLPSGCSQQTVAVPLRPLQSSGDVSFVCRVGAFDPNRSLMDSDPKKTVLGEGRPLDECNPGSIARGERDLFALVTQTTTGEIAVINVPLDPANQQFGDGVVDVDPAVPGFGFLHIGAEPGQIVSTPGGHASFVGVGEVGKPGIYALPTTCVGQPSEGEADRDLTTWPACSLPAVPGAMVVAVDPPTAEGVSRSCARIPGDVEIEDRDRWEEEPRRLGECSVDLRDEDGPDGRRKLLVALPDRGTIAVIDAQELLNRPQGSFGPCTFEREIPLKVELPVAEIKQIVPDDLGAGECGVVSSPLPPPAAGYRATPSDFELAGGKLYVADATAPVVHVLNAEQPCALAEAAPLLTRALENPGRVVTTSKVAVSPLTPSGKRFAYAIDQYDWPTATVMIFDVSPGSTDPTPIVRPRAPYLPFEAADRIQFTGSAKDVTFVLRDRPRVDSVTGNVVVGTACDPDPRIPEDSVAAKYRPSTDFSSGARASELRGLFASVLLTSGQVSIVDIEDFDAPCRRPIQANSSAVEDFRGCQNDDPNVPIYATQSGPTVTGEVSCRMVDPHRLRSANIGISSNFIGVRAPSLRALPQLRVPDSATQSTFRTRPKLLAVNFPGPNEDGEPAEVYVNATRYSAAIGAATPLAISPDNDDERYSLALPFNEPRAYPGTNDLSLTFEGAITGILRNGFIETRGDGDDTLPAGVMRLRDPSAGYCDAGVSDPEVMRELGERRLGLSGNPLENFAARHSDYVVLTSDFPASDDRYWSAAACSRTTCEGTFGKWDAKLPLTTRDFQVLDAQQQVLLLAPRHDPGAAVSLEQDEALVELASCCFPSGTEYVVRASNQWVLRGTVSGFRHQVRPLDVTVDGQKILNCVYDCNPRKRFFESRVFEIASASCTGPDCSVGMDPDSPCQSANAAAGIKLTDSAARCIHSTSTERFAVYRGASPSVRDMRFSWQVVGGFSAQRIDLSVYSAAVSPQTLVGLPQFGWLTVVDSASLGLAQVSLDSLGMLTPSLN